MYTQTRVDCTWTDERNPEASNILLVTVHVSCKIVDFIHQCVYTDIMFFFSMAYDIMYSDINS